MAAVAIITDDPGWHGARLRQAFAAYGLSSHYVSLRDCRLSAGPGAHPVVIPGFERTLPDAVFVRGVPGGSLEEVVFYLDILHALKTLGVPVYNDGYAIERSVDKGMTSFLLHHAGIPSPLTWVLTDRSQALSLAEQQLQQGKQLITKPLFGSQGEGLRRYQKYTDLFWLTGSQGIIYMQQFVESDGDGYSDWRVFVINGEVLAVMQRQGVCWLNNVARGATCQAVSADQEMQTLALRSVAALDMDYAGVDIIRDRNGSYQVIEVNSIPAWKGLQSVCNIDVAAVLVKDLLKRYLPALLADNTRETG